MNGAALDAQVESALDAEGHAADSRTYLDRLPGEEHP